MIVLRNDVKRPLTYEEVDGNFKFLNEAKNDVEDALIKLNQIESKLETVCKCDQDLTESVILTGVSEQSGGFPYILTIDNYNDKFTYSFNVSSGSATRIGWAMEKTKTSTKKWKTSDNQIVDLTINDIAKIVMAASDEQDKLWLN